MSGITWDAFASPDRVGEIHRLGMDLFVTNDLAEIDNEVLGLRGKFPQELTRDEAAQLIRLWGGK